VSPAALGAVLATVGACGVVAVWSVQLARHRGAVLRLALRRYAALRRTIRAPVVSGVRVTPDGLPAPVVLLGATPRDTVPPPPPESFVIATEARRRSRRSRSA